MLSIRVLLNKNNWEVLIMKCIGKAKLFNIEVEKKRSVGQIYFATKVGEDEETGEPIFETDFCNAVFLGKAHKLLKEIEKMEELHKKPIFITESQIRLKSGKRKDETYWNYNELVVFDFEETEEIPGESEEKPVKAKPRGGYKRK